MAVGSNSDSLGDRQREPGTRWPAPFIITEEYRPGSRLAMLCVNTEHEAGAASVPVRILLAPELVGSLPPGMSISVSGPTCSLPSATVHFLPDAFPASPSYSTSLSPPSVLL